MTIDVVPVKCLVWDLDNTLWQGTLLEGDEVRPFEAVRDTITALDARGILQCVASRNDHDHAWEQLRRDGLADYFVLARIGWGRKSDAVRAIADELRFAYGTIAFIDDQPAERDEVRFHLPEVRCYRAEEAAELPDRPEFRPRTVTADAGRRRSMYQANIRRESAREAFTGPDEDFLRSLDLVLSVERAGADLSRVEELTLRTSQMNATGVHYSEAALRELSDDPGHDVLVASLTDRYGSHGSIGVLLIEYHSAYWRLKLLATSCRVVSMGVGAVLLNWIVDTAAAAGVHLVADFRATGRNRMMEVLYRFAGLTEDSCECHPAGEAGTVALHLVPDARPAPATMRLTTPVLGGLGVRTGEVRR